MKLRLSKHLSFGIAVVALAVVLALPVSASGFTRGIVINVDGADFYLAGAPDAPGGALDVPGHYWVQAGPDKIVGKHFNTGPFGAPQWWSSDAADGEFLFKVDGIIDTWTLDKAADYAARGYVHYHELVQVSDGTTKHPDKVVWLQHKASKNFYLDGGPHPEFAHYVKNGRIDYEFMPNWQMPYP